MKDLFLPVLDENNGQIEVFNDTDYFSSIYSNNTLEDSWHWQCVEYKLNDNEIAQIQTFSFWMEGVCQFILGAIGIISNLLAIPILCHKRMNKNARSIFSKLLICLLVLHTIYIGCILLMELMWPSWYDNPQRISEYWFIFIFSYGLNPLKQLMHYSSTFFTMLMARQRFLAIRHPIEYRNSTLTINPWVSVMKSLSFVILTGSLFTFPLYLETSMKHIEVDRIEEFNSTHFKLVGNFNCLHPGFNENLMFVPFDYFHIDMTYILSIGTQKRSYVGFKSNPSKLALCDLV